MKSKSTYIILTFFISVIFSSCNGQHKIDTTQAKLDETSFGESQSEIPLNSRLIFHDSNGNYWFGNELGIYFYNGKELLHFSTEDGLISNRVIDVQEDHIGNVYFDTPEGVSKYDGKSFTTLKLGNTDPSTNEWKLNPTDLMFRIGWENKGPYRYDGEKLYPLEFPKSKIEDELYKNYPNISYNPYAIFSMFKDSKGHFWFGTSDLGIYRFNGEQISWMHEDHLATTNEGGSFGVRSIAEDKNGYFWICNSRYKYKILSDSTRDASLVPIKYIREKGLTSKKDTDYYMEMLLDKNETLWMMNGDEVWQNNDVQLTPFYIKSGDKEISPNSVYEDNNGILWFGTEKSGIFKFDGNSFEKFKVE